MSTYKITQNLKLKVHDRLFAGFKKNMLDMEEKGLLKAWELKIVEVSDEG